VLLLGYPSGVHLHISEQEIEIRLSLPEKVLGLLRNIRLERSQIVDVQVVENPLHDVMRVGLKVGLRLPWLYYVCRTIRLDQAWAVRRGVPAISFGVHDHGALQRVTVSTRDAREIAERLGS
jgi:hypothetical protein